MTLPKIRVVMPPPDGWEEHTWYLVDVAYKPSNPIHRSLFYTGFLSRERVMPGLNEWRIVPGNYNGLVPLNGPDFEDRPKSISQVFYLRFVRKILSRAKGEEFFDTSELHGKEE